MADLTVDVLTFQNSLVDPSNSPKLSCAAANQLALEVSSLRLDGSRELVFRDSGQIRCFDDHHRLVFNRPALRLELHEQGDISFLTGGPPPVERMVILANGNVGVGVANPIAPLEVAGFIRATDGLESNAAKKMQVGTREAQPLELLTNNNAALTIDAGGRVGINTATPAASLQVVGGAIMPAIGNIPNAGIQFPANPGGGSGDEAFIRYFATTGETTKLLIGVGNEAGDTIGFWQAGAERMTLSAGNLGIGATSPPAKLTVDDPGSDTTWNTAAFRKAALGPNWSHIHWGTKGDWYIRSASGTGKVILQDTGGNVGMGIADPRTPLHVFGRIATGLDFRSAGAITFFPPDGFAWFHIDNGPAGGRPLGRLRISHGGTPGVAEIVSITQQARVGIGITSPQAMLHVAGSLIAQGVPFPSDSRLKTNVEPLGNVVEKLAQVRAVSFNWNEKYQVFGAPTEKREIGVIAQELEAVFPEVVTTLGDENYKAVDYGRLTAVLVEAAKELLAKNEALARRVEELEAIAPTGGGQR